MDDLSWCRAPGTVLQVWSSYGITTPVDLVSFYVNDEVVRENLVANGEAPLWAYCGHIVSAPFMDVIGMAEAAASNQRVCPRCYACLVSEVREAVWTLHFEPELLKDEVAYVDN